MRRKKTKRSVAAAWHIIRIRPATPSLPHCPSLLQLALFCYLTAPPTKQKKSQRVVVVMRDPLCSLGNHCYDSGLSHSGLISLACAQKG